jgi:hypothetical protein
MDYGIRDSKLIFTDIVQTSTSEEFATADQEQKKMESGIAATEDSIEGLNENSVFTADPTAGQINFGDGFQGSKLPENESEVQAGYQTGLGETGNSGTPVKEFELLIKGAKSQISSYLNGQKIDSQMEEAKEKTDAAMQQATTGVWTGVIGGAVSIGSAISELKSFAETAKNEIAQKSSRNSDRLEARYQYLVSVINEQDAEIKSAEGRYDRIRDAILDLLSKLDEFPPKI